MDWRSSVIGGAVAGLGAYLSRYWAEAPEVMKIALCSLMPLLVVDGLSAIGAARLVGVKDKCDSWQAASVRFLLVLVLIVLAFAVDALTGTRHMTVLWVLLWACVGHARAAWKHCGLIAHVYGIDLMGFPGDRWDAVDDMMDTIDGPGEEKQS